MENKEEIGKVFDDLSVEYTAFMERAVPHYRELIGSLAVLPLNFGASEILDLGCGNGNVTAVLIQTYPEANFTLLDASDEMIKQCEERFIGKGFRLLKEYFQEATFPPGSFDLIVAGFSIHHLQKREKEKLFCSIYSWLKQGGRFAYSDLMVSRSSKDHDHLLQSWKTHAQLLGTTKDEWDYIIDHYGKYDFPDDWQEQIAWLKDAGFKIVKVPWRKGYWCNLQAIK